MGDIQFKEPVIPANLKADLEADISDLNGHLIGLVLGFRKVHENKRTKQYKTDYVSTIINQNEKKDIEALVILYTCNKNGILRQCKGNLKIEIKDYIGTIKPPLSKTSSNILSASDLINTSYILPFEYSDLEKCMHSSVDV